jgi:PAS domain S-box-containing protein
MPVNERLASDEGGSNTHTMIAAQSTIERQLRERIKELSCLYELAALLSDRTLSQAQLGQAFVARLVAAWQFPEVTCARLHLYDQRYATPNFAETPWQLRSHVTINDAHAGYLTVGYLAACPDADEGPFLREERSLLDQCAWQLGQTLAGRQAHAALAAHEDFLQSIVTATPDIVFIVDREARITYINRVPTGITVEQAIGTSAIDYVASPHRQLVRDAIDYVFTTGQLTNYEIQARGENESVVWYTTRLAPMLQDAQVAQVLLITEDITERKQREAAQRTSEQRYRIAFESAMDAMLLTAPTGEVLAANPAACAMFGWSEAEIQQLGRAGLLDTGDPQLVAALETLTRAGHFRGELTFRRRDGSSFPGEVSSTVFVDQDGNRRISMFIHDISARKAAETQRSYLATLLAHMPAAVISTDTDLRIQSWNAHAEVMYGWRADEVMGRPLDDICQSRFVDTSQAAAQATLQATGVWRGEIEQRRRDDRPLYVDASVAALRNAQGTIIGGVTINVDITARKQATQALADSERHFRALFENMTLGVVYQAADGGIMLANRAAEEILGMTFDQMQGRTSIDSRWRAVREDGSDFPGAEHPAMVALRTGQIVTDVLMGVYHPARDEQRWIRIAAVPEFRPGETQPFRVFATFDDITARRRAEQALAHSEANYRAAISAVGAIAYSIDYLANRYAFMSPSAEELTGYPLAMLTPDLFSSLLLTSTPAGPFTGMTTVEASARIRSGQGGTMWHCDYQIQTRNGEERWVYDVSVQIMGEADVPVGAIGILQDITERKRMEAALRASEEQQRQLAAALEQRVQKRTAELQAQRDFASQIMDTLGQGLVVGDSEGRAVYVNPAMATLLGAPPATLSGARFTDFVAVEDLPLVNKLFPLRREDENFQFEVRLRTASGQIKPVLVSTTPHRQGSAVIGRIALFTDLTEIKAVEASLRQSRDEFHAANAALEQALRMKDEFLASMSHELRTPLTGILGLSEALQMQTYGALNARQLRSVETIWESGQHLLSLINDILDLSKLAAAQLDMEFEQCDVADICHSSLSLIKGMAQKKQLHVDLMIDPMDMSICADPRRLKQMLVNLLSNAVKFTPAHGNIGLRVQGNAERQVIEFAVWDKGIGIDAADIERIFLPFTQLDAGLAREYAGTGLGLALVDRMAHVHNGTVGVISAPDKGSTFTLTLPWTPQLPTALTSPPLAPSHTTAINITPISGSAPLLLLAEDDAINAEMLIEYLTEAGCRVMHVKDGLEAVQQAVALHPDLILMDIQMPHLDGLQAIQQIRSHPDDAIASVPIIALTAQAMPGDAEHCLEAGANAYLSKPFRFGDVLHLIATHVKGEIPPV